MNIKRLFTLCNSNINSTPHCKSKNVFGLSALFSSFIPKPKDIPSLPLSVTVITCQTDEFTLSFDTHAQWQDYIQKNCLQSIKNISLQKENPLETYNWSTCVFQKNILQEMCLQPKEARVLVALLYDFLSDPFQVAASLQSVDAALGEEMKKQGIRFDKKDHPDAIILGRDNWIAGPPPADYVYQDKGRILSQVLLRKEQEMGINLQGVATFVGFVDPKEADPFIMEGNVFKEDTDISRLLLHGKNSHRMHILACCAYLQGQERFRHLSAKQLLRLLITSQGPLEKDRRKESYSLWTFLIDKAIPYEKKKPGTLYNCQSPMNIQSLIVNFGEAVGLSHLMYCMRDSFWKSMKKHIHRLDATISDTDPVAYQIAYLRVVLELSYNHRGNSDIGAPYRFTLAEHKAGLQKKYVPFDEDHPVCGIMRKTLHGKEASEEQMWKKTRTFLQNDLAIKEIFTHHYSQQLENFYLHEASTDHIKRLVRMYWQMSYIQPGKLAHKHLLTVIQKIDWKQYTSKEIEEIFAPLSCMYIDAEIMAIWERLDLTKCSYKTKKFIYQAAAMNTNIKLLEKLGIDYPPDSHGRKFIHSLISEEKKDAVEYILARQPKLWQVTDIDQETVEQRVQKRKWVFKS